MRIIPALATAAFLATTPCMAQVIIGGNDAAAARHEDQADHQEHAAQRDEHRAQEDARAGDYRDANREQARAQDHAAAAQHQERRADQDQNGVTIQIPR
jgi:hypothetical protein